MLERLKVPSKITLTGLHSNVWMVSIYFYYLWILTYLQEKCVILVDRNLTLKPLFHFSQIIFIFYIRFFAAVCSLDCGPNGVCESSKCRCNPGWTGNLCDQLPCDARCSEHGQCKNGTCVCSQGWNGRHCTLRKYWFQLIVIPIWACVWFGVRCEGGYLMHNCRASNYDFNSPCGCSWTALKPRWCWQWRWRWRCRVMVNYRAVLSLRFTISTA